MEFNSVRGLIFACIIVRFFAEDCRGGRFQTVSPICPFQEKYLRIFCSSVSVVCEHKYWFVFPTFSDYISEKWDRRLWGGLDRARGVPIGFQAQHFNHWAITALLTLILFWWNPIPSSDKFLLTLIFDFLLRVVVVVVSKRCRLHVLSRKSNWESLVRQSRLLASTSIGSCSQLLPNILLKKKIERCEQGSNLRGKFPLDFKSNALTTRPSQLFWHYSFFWCNLIPSVD